MGLKTITRQVLGFPYPISIDELKAYLEGPKILVNSMPKSGTHLLKRVFDLSPMLVPRWTYGALTDNTRNLNKKLISIRRGQYILGHLHWTAELSQCLAQGNIRTIFIIRDPRDQLVSDAQFITYKHPKHRLHRYFQSLSSDEQRIQACIEGIAGNLLPDGKASRSLNERLEDFMPWLKDSSCLTVHFEDLVGSSGGGSDEKQLETVSSIFEHIRLRLDEDQIKRISKNIYSERSHTFRKGTIGDWKNHLTDDHKNLLKLTVGKQLIELGYANSLD